VHDLKTLYMQYRKSLLIVGQQKVSLFDSVHCAYGRFVLSTMLDDPLKSV
jgi:hypothetical protein